MAFTNLAQRTADSVSVNSVIKNTYMLLSMTLLFSAFTAWVSMKINMPTLGLFSFIGYMAMMYAVSALRNSAWGIVAVFGLTGFLGLSLGPMLNQYLRLSNGAELIMTSLGGTGIIFFALSGYALTAKQNFSYLAGFLGAGSLVMVLAILVSIFFPMPILHLAISSGIMLLSAGYIIYETSELINGGERNYLMATVSMYVNLYNIFVSLLHILATLSGRRD